ncbi:PH (Pleckstrin Homology) domain-containing protein [Geothermobacter ehrlichii]|uniref:PH (Pleckstrin Homology) domain-containing protein n=1 Tax=Geothermobacter ehrlichii TaxID=213224 RepID=A0A5D3WNA1_9BACT|nr:PH domain-containing protein [Geothermobacter ehrlichii]TYO99994.1 PH (Pleckstrin Homology) domain-containing protein [Geothermobacter ehrlichii]
MIWSDQLEAGESIRWEATPAPRCYTFRHWKVSLFGLLLVLLASWWEVLAWQMAAVYQLAWLPLIPLPVWLFGLYLAIGKPLLARREWETVRYAVTGRRLLARRGRKRLALPLDRIGYFCLEPHGENLGSVRVESKDGQIRLCLCCIEYPRQLTDLLEEAMRRSGTLCEREATAIDSASRGG